MKPVYYQEEPEARRAPPAADFADVLRRHGLSVTIRRTASGYLASLDGATVSDSRYWNALPAVSVGHQTPLSAVQGLAQSVAGRWLKVTRSGSRILVPPLLVPGEMRVEDWGTKFV